MTEVLSQEEIDQLLKAISTGEEEESGVGRRAGRKNIKMYDFKRPDKISKEQIRTISIMHETYARLTTTALSAMLRSIVQVHVASVDQLTYEEFIRSIPSPASLAIINMDPLKGSAILEIDPAITFAIIDRLFGGSGELTKIGRELSDIEQTVMEGVIVRILGNMREAWGQVVDLRPRLGQIETNPQFAQIVPPSTMVVLVTLEMKVESVDGMMNFCFPYLTIESIVSKLSAQYWYSSIQGGATTENLNTLREKLSGSLLPLVAEVGGVELPMREVYSLEVGDVVQMRNAKVGNPMVLKVGDRPKFFCRPGVLGKKIAVQITGKVETSDEGEELEEFVEDAILDVEEE